MPQDVTTPVLRNIDLGHGNYLVEFSSPSMTAGMKPGQFFMIGIPGSETLLRRPYSVCGLPGTFDDAPRDSVRVLYKVVGRGTALLAALKSGAPLTVLGPLGNGFEAPSPAAVRPVFVAGGIGSAPFPALARWLDGRCRPPWMFYGARSAIDLPLLDWFRRHADEVVTTTEDGTAGRRGLVTEPLIEFLDSTDAGELHLYACGPEPMLRAVAALARRRGLRCDLSLEAHMACGFGVCLGCVVPTTTDGSHETRYDRVCVEGPVMEAGRLAW
ncbi:MAG TPA: dihydroorotate dehydrogenase electron transfer subunit [Candidatus Polarisedimenticolaceae bacterium]|nr:dihydroorotate dehydrogenase electron transfer subunit [Candidatus Polarisedimenticolaceae bacterium]